MKLRRVVFENTHVGSLCARQADKPQPNLTTGGEQAFNAQQ